MGEVQPRALGDRLLRDTDRGVGHTGRGDDRVDQLLARHRLVAEGGVGQPLDHARGLPDRQLVAADGQRAVASGEVYAEGLTDNLKIPLRRPGDADALLAGG